MANFIEQNKRWMIIGGAVLLIAVFALVYFTIFGGSVANNNASKNQTASNNHSNNTSNTSTSSENAVPGITTGENGETIHTIVVSHEDGTKDVYTVTTQTDGTTTVVNNSKQESGTSIDESTSTSQEQPAYDYASYSALTAEEQYAYYLTYSNPEDFFNWYNNAKAVYDATHQAIEIRTGDVVDLG